MKVKDIIGMFFSNGQVFEIRGTHSGKFYYNSYVNDEQDLQKYLDKEVPNKPIYSEMRIKGLDSNSRCISVIVIWIYDYNMCKQGEEV